MRRFLELSVSKMMLILTASGFVVALTFAGPQIGGMLQERQKLQADALKTQLAARIGAMTHELQKERGASAGFISSNGGNFADALPTRRAESDAVIAGFLSASEVVEGVLPAGSPTLDRIRDVRTRKIALDQ